MRPARLALWTTPRGVGVLLVLCVLLTLTTVAAWLSVVLVAALAGALALFAADARAGPRASDLEVTREPLRYATVGRPAELAYVLDNRSAAALRVRLFEAWLPGVTFSEDEALVDVPARARVTFRRTFVPHERGSVAFGALYARVDNGFALLRRRFVQDAPFVMRIFPDLRAVEGYGSLARRSTLLESGLRKMRLRGTGNEFESLRDYADGDSFRRVDWKASARRGKLMVVQYDVERSQNVLLAVDAGRLMTARVGEQRKFDHALTAALCMARVAQAAGDNVGFVAFAAHTLLHVVPRRGIAHGAALVRAANDLQPRLEEADYEAFAAEVKRRYAKRSLVVLFTDLFDPVASAAVAVALGTLAGRHVVLCVLMNDAAIAQALSAQPRTARDAYRLAVALRLDDERRETIARLRARGVIVVDAPARRLTPALLDAYLDVKARGTV